MSSLRLEIVKRAGGGGRSEVVFRDFVIDGTPLWPRLQALGFDVVTGLLDSPREWVHAYVDRLLLRATPDLPDGRVALYLCPECGDIACGLVSVQVAQKGDHIEWGAFASEGGVGSEAWRTPLTDLGPFVFPAADYAACLEHWRQERVP